ncbi:MAG: hypothetical protein ABI758_04605 [Candidatus Woesebacteria bacterium]
MSEKSPIPRNASTFTTYLIAAIEKEKEGYPVLPVGVSGVTIHAYFLHIIHGRIQSYNIKNPDVKIKPPYTKKKIVFLLDLLSLLAKEKNLTAHRLAQTGCSLALLQKLIKELES